MPICVKLGIHIRVCEYVMRLVAYDFSVFEYHAQTHTHPYIRIPSLLILGFDILCKRIRIRANGFLAYEHTKHGSQDVT